MRKNNKKKFSRGFYSANGMIIFDGSKSYKQIVRTLKRTKYVAPAEDAIDTITVRWCPNIVVNGKKGGYVTTTYQGKGSFAAKVFDRRYARLIILKTDKNR